MSRGKHIKKEEHDRIVEMRRSGMTLNEIVEETGRPLSTVRFHLKGAKYVKVPVTEEPQGNIIDNFTPLYNRIKYLNEQKKKLDDELQNIRATLQNAVNIIDSGDTAQPVKPSWGGY